MNKAIILHGTDNDNTGNWIPWLKSRLEKEDYEVYSPSLPDSSNPNAQKWSGFIIKNAPFAIDDNTTIIGHSSGAALIPKLLQTLPAKTEIKKAILVSGFHTSLGWNQLDALQNIDVDYQKVKQMADKFILVHSDNDPYVPITEAKWLSDKLGADLKIINGQGHFNLEASPGYREFPKLLEIALE